MKPTTQNIKAALKESKNLSYDKKAGVFTVRFPSGIHRQYKTFKIAVARAKEAVLDIEIPMIVTAKTYYWNSSGNAGRRRANEHRRQMEIDDFCLDLNKLPGFEIKGHYSESGRNVYKNMTYCINDKNTNLTGLIGAAKKWGINLVK